MTQKDCFIYLFIYVRQNEVKTNKLRRCDDLHGPCVRHMCRNIHEKNDMEIVVIKNYRCVLNFSSGFG